MRVSVVELYDLNAEVVDHGASDVIKWLKAHGRRRTAYTVIVGGDEMPSGLAAALRAEGCKDGYPVTVVIEQ